MLRPALILAAALLAPALTLTPALADFDRAAVEALRDGHMKKLMFHEAPQPVPDTVFADIDGVESSLAAYEGKIVVLNFWATWCAPCRKEMPSLDRLNMALGGEDFAVVTLATGRNSPQGMRRFFEEESIETLPLLPATVGNYQDFTARVQAPDGAEELVALRLWPTHLVYLGDGRAPQPIWAGSVARYRVQRVLYFFHFWRREAFQPRREGHPTSGSVGTLVGL